jgi:RecA-family ATPase
VITPAELAERIRQHGSAVRGGPTQWAAQCPAHDDRAPSLSIGTGTEGVPLVHCQAGCRPEDVLGAVGLTLADLMPDRDRPERPRVVATYPYVDEHGVLLYEVRRIEPAPDGSGRGKTFRPYRPGARRPGLGNVRRVLYRLPEVIQAAAAGGTVYVCEGEKDADALAKRGLVATCNVGGAGRGKWKPEYSQHLAGAHVIVVADRDTPGIEHARAVADALTGHAASVRIMLPAVDREHADLSDHLEAGYDVDELVPLGDEPPASAGGTPDEGARAEGSAPSDAFAAKLRASLLTTDELDSIPDPDPLIEDILMRDSLAWLYGKPGHGKSFVALDWAGHIATGRPWWGRAVAPGPVLYLVAEGVRGIRRRVRAWEQHHGTRMTGVTVLPMAVQLLNWTELTALVDLVADLQPAMVVLDTQSRVAVGAEENSAAEMSRLVDAMERIREASEACVLTVHHAPRTGDNLRGSTTLEGAAITIVRATRDGGRVRLVCDKQKDDPEFDPIDLRFESVGESVVLVPDNDVQLIDPVDRVVSLLDRVGAPPDAGRDRCRALLAEHGLRVGTDLLRQAVKIRKNRTNDLTSDTLRQPLGQTPEKPDRAPDHRSGKTAGQTRPGQVQVSQVSWSDSDLTDLTTTRRVVSQVRSTRPDAEESPAEEAPSALTEVPEEWGEWSA